VWENMVGGHSGYWAEEFRTMKGGRVQFYKDENYEHPNPQDIQVLADDEWHDVTVRSLAEAYVKLKQDGWHHCGKYDIDEEDACTGDALLQMAAFGEFVYG
jgi:hypothetical protein